MRGELLAALDLVERPRHQWAKAAGALYRALELLGETDRPARPVLYDYPGKSDVAQLLADARFIGEEIYVLRWIGRKDGAEKFCRLVRLALQKIDEESDRQALSDEGALVAGKRPARLEREMSEDFGGGAHGDH